MAIQINGTTVIDNSRNIKSVGTGTFSGKVTAASTSQGDIGTTLTTKDYVDANVEEAPTDGQQYARQDAGWSAVTATGTNVAIATGRVSSSYVYLGGFGCTINRNGLAAGGLYFVVFDTPQPNANYIIQVTSSQEGTQGLFCTATYRSVTTTGFQVVITAGAAQLANADTSFVVYSA